MKGYFIMLLLILVNLGVVLYIDYRINLLDLNYYNGKDGGLIVRFQVTIAMSVIYFFVMSKKNKIIFAIYGFLVGILSMVICYLIIGEFTNLSDVFYQLTAMTLFILVFHIIEKKGNVSD